MINNMVKSVWIHQMYLNPWHYSSLQVPISGNHILHITDFHSSPLPLTPSLPFHQKRVHLACTGSCLQHCSSHPLNSLLLIIIPKPALSHPSLPSHLLWSWQPCCSPSLFPPPFHFFCQVEHLVNTRSRCSSLMFYYRNSIFGWKTWKRKLN